MPWVRVFRGIVLSLFFPLSLSLAIPQFRLLSHVSSLWLPSGHSGPVLMLSNSARSSPFSPRLLVVDVSVWGTSLLGAALRHVICGFYLFIFFSRLCRPPRFENFPQTGRWEGFLVFGNFSSIKTPFPGWISIPDSLFFSFIFCPTAFQRQWAAFLGAWCPLPAFRSCFVESAQCSNVLLMNLWGIKWSPHPSPPPHS